MKKILAYLSILSILNLPTVVLAQGGEGQLEALPEQEGVYSVPNRPKMKLRVFVHHEKPQNSPVLELTCNLPDPDSAAVVDPAGWHLPNVWTYNLNLASVPAAVGRQNLPTIASNAFGTWLNAIGDKVNITRGADTLASRARFDGQNIIAWGRTSGTALAVSYIWYSIDTGLAAEVDTIFNQKFVWGWSDPSSWSGQTPSSTTCAYQAVYDAQGILTHELGHSFGLDDEYANAYVNNTMYGYGAKSETRKDTLTKGDMNGVQALYP